MNPIAALTTNRIISHPIKSHTDHIFVSYPSSWRTTRSKLWTQLQIFSGFQPMQVQSQGLRKWIWDLGWSSQNRLKMARCNAKTRLQKKQALKASGLAPQGIFVPRKQLHQLSAGSTCRIGGNQENKPTRMNKHIPTIWHLGPFTMEPLAESKRKEIGS